MVAFVRDGVADLVVVGSSDNEELVTNQCCPVGDLDNFIIESCYVSGPRWSLVPSKLFQADQLAAYLQPLHLPLRAVFIDSIQANLVFELPDASCGNASRISHLVELLIEAGERIKLEQDNFVLIFMRENELWLSLCRNKEHLVDQHFRARSEADVVFHTASLLQSYGLDSETTPIIIGGAINDSGLIWRRMATYFSLTKLEDSLGIQEAELVPDRIANLLAYQCLLQSEFNEADFYENNLG